MFQTMTGSRLQRFMQLLTTTMPMKEQLSLQKTPKDTKVSGSVVFKGEIPAGAL